MVIIIFFAGSYRAQQLVPCYATLGSTTFILSVITVVLLIYILGSKLKYSRGQRKKMEVRTIADENCFIIIILNIVSYYS